MVGIALEWRVIICIEIKERGLGLRLKDYAFAYDASQLQASIVGGKAGPWAALVFRIFLDLLFQIW